MEHKHSVYDTDTHFVIVKDTREIQLETKAAPVIVQHDHNSERFSFELPRYIDGHDMTLCNEVQVHYLNIDSATKETAKGVFLVDDMGLLEGDANTAVCSWLISENATKYAGKLNFMIRFACLADDGTVLYRWNTGIYTDLSVVSGYDNGEAVTEDFPDILAQWKAELFGIGDTEEQRIKDASAAEQAAIAAKGAEVLATIPEDYTETHNMAASALQSMANAIKGKLSGAVVFADDVSPVEHSPVVKVVCPDGVDPSTVTVKRCGKNLLLNGGGNFTQNGITFETRADGTVKVSGTATATTTNIFTWKADVVNGERYILSGCPSGGGTGKTFVLRCYNSLGDETVRDDEGNGVEFLFANAMGDYNFAILVSNGATINATFKPMLRLASITDAAYEPYNGAEYTPAADGTVSGITSLSPNMTILSDTDGAIVECEYNVDTKAYIDKKIAELMAQ